MYTSYFARYKGDNGISIALKSPSWFKGLLYPALFPRWSFLSPYKQTGDIETFTWEYHKQVLRHLNPELVYEDLRDHVLLCWEKPSDFCHRRLVASWIEKELGIVVPEFEFK